MKGKATIHRMVMAGHICPYGLKAVDLLEREDYEVTDHHLRTKDETEQFKAEHGVETTPQIWIDGERVGGYDELRVRLGKDEVKEDGATSYRPVVTIFVVALAIALAIGALADRPALDWRLLPAFFATTMTLLAMQKLQDVEGFSLMFLNYDLLAQRLVRYASLYPYGEGLAGVLMLAGVLPWVSGPIAAFIGLVGTISVLKAVYVDQRELACACVGSGSKVPLGFVSLTENLVMLGMGIWTILVRT